MNKTPISISIQRNDLTLIDRIAHTNEMSRSEVIGIALHEYLERYQGLNEVEDLARRIEILEREHAILVHTVP